MIYFSGKLHKIDFFHRIYLCLVQLATTQIGRKVNSIIFTVNYQFNCVITYALYKRVHLLQEIT